MASRPSTMTSKLETVFSVCSVMLMQMMPLLALLALLASSILAYPPMSCVAFSQPFNTGSKRFHRPSDTHLPHHHVRSSWTCSETRFGAPFRSLYDSFLAYACDIRLRCCYRACRINPAVSLVNGTGRCLFTAIYCPLERNRPAGGGVIVLNIRQCRSSGAEWVDLIMGVTFVILCI